MKKKDNTFIGYVTPNIFNGMRIPLTLQQKSISEYIGLMQGTYKLSQTELIIENEYTTLYSIINEAKKNSNIIMCSLFMLPKKINIRNEIFAIIKKKKINFFFVFEKYKLNYKNINDLELFISLFEAVKNTNYPFK